MRTDNRPFWDDALNVILSQVPPAGLDFPASGTRASATDVPAVSLEWMVTDAYPGGAWFGDCGQPTLAQLYALPTAYLATGARASVAGVQYTYSAGAGWVGGASALSAPPASGDFVGQLIWVVNPAVPRGRSRLEWTGLIWAPPAGELIVAVWRGAAPVALVTPGVTALTTIYQSDVIPDYMLPANLKMIIDGFLVAKNASGTSGCLLALVLSGSVPNIQSSPSPYQYPLAATVTPSATGSGISASPTYPKNIPSGIISIISSRAYFSSTFNLGPLEMEKGSFPIIAGSNRLFAMAHPSSTEDQIQFDGASVVSKGNL